jgi:hypothetical protein
LRYMEEVDQGCMIRLGHNAIVNRSRLVRRPAPHVPSVKVVLR